MKFVNTPISVDVHKGVPRQIRRGRRVYRVRRLLDYWILQSRWWGREEKRVYFRLETDGGVMEVYREEGGVRNEVGEQRREKGRARGDGGKVRGEERRGEKSEERTEKSGGERDGSRAEKEKSESGFGGSAPVANASGGAAAHPSGGPAAHLPFVEGDTHTRELRQTESPYRPDAADLAGRRRMRNSAAKTPEKAPRTRWVLSKVVD